MIMRFLTLFFAIFLLFSCGKNTTRFERLDAGVTGIDFINEIVEKDTFNIMHNEYMYNGGGVGVVDLNNDGLMDLVFTGNKVTSRIYLNQGNFTFKDISKQFEGLTNQQWISGVSIIDINADGWTDLYFASTMSKDSLLRKNQLWVNQGAGSDRLPSFKEMADQYGIADAGHSMHATFFDYDLDGDLDLYILNNVVGKEVPTNYHPKVTDGTAINNDKFYRNDGNGHFTDITKQAGIVYEGFGLGIAVGDVNKDGYPDLYISNDYISNDLFYINQDDGTFRNEVRDYISYMSRFSMGNDMADINNDGNLDVMTMDMMPEQYFRKKQTINGNSYNIYDYNRKYNYETQYVRNMLHLHNGFIDGKMLPFSEAGQMMGIYQTEWSWSPLFADYDNDGDRDLLVTNGFPKDLTDKDFTNYKAQMYGYLAGDYDIIPRIPIVKVSNYAFENMGDYSFANHTKEWGMDIPSFSNGAAFVDLDNDGDLDYVTNNINDPVFVFKNNTLETAREKPNFLRIALTGNPPNTLAIGAKVELWSGGQLQYIEHFLSRGYISSVDPVIHFGLGKNAGIDSIKVIWPAGKRITFLKGVQPNQTLSLKESEAAAYEGKIAPPAGQATLFNPAVDVLDYTHVQNDYFDFFQNQRIIQHKFSQVGPCMAKGDLDGDGKEDLFIGGSAESPAVAYLQKGTAFEKTAFAGLTDQKQCLESDITILDVDKDGDNDVVALAGGYANEKEEAYRHYLYRNNGGTFVKEELPVPPFIASVVRPCDVDQDGDLDLFIGARVKRVSFPLAPSSYILINENGRFSSQKALAFDLGMVTDAAWSDFDGDGWKDLLLTREWNSIALLKNGKGQEFKLISQKEIEDKRGFWYGIAAADLDSDGDDDYILGNLGENHRFNVSDKYPMGLYAVDIDKNGVIDPVVSAFWNDKKGVMQEYPVNYLDELAAQSPFFRKRFTSYTQFSYTKMDSIVDQSTAKTGEKMTVNTTSSYILWNEGGKFQWERLPAAAQTAPVRKILVRDFNGDKQPDLLLVGNDHSFDVSTGYYDANRGLVLLGKGKRAFEVLSASRSGLSLKGQVESLELVEGENASWLIVGVNRDKIKVFKHLQKQNL
jgi:hypothetical protein